MKKIIVIGCPGSGKSTFSKELKKIYNLPLYHLDLIWNKPDKTTITREEFDNILSDIYACDEWIIDGNYQRTIEKRIKEANTIYLLDYPLEVCLGGAMSRVGVKREDMPWIEQELNEEFKQKILDFSNTKLPVIYELLDKYKENKEIIIFKNREESGTYLKTLNEKVKTIVFATGNPTKAKRFKEGLLKTDINTLCLKDLNIDLDVEENGRDAIENALIKARECFKKTNMPSIGMDDTLYLENVPDELQPGLFVRRVNGKTLNDDEMIDHYTNLVKQYGMDGKLNCKWIYGLAVINKDGVESTYTWCKDNFYMVEEATKKINPGYPLNSISKYKLIDKYFTEATKEDLDLIKVNEDHVIEFIKKHV